MSLENIGTERNMDLIGNCLLLATSDIVDVYRYADMDAMCKSIKYKKINVINHKAFILLGEVYNEQCDFWNAVNYLVYAYLFSKSEDLKIKIRRISSKFDKIQFEQIVKSFNSNESIEPFYNK